MLIFNVILLCTTIIQAFFLKKRNKSWWIKGRKYQCTWHSLDFSGMAYFVSKSIWVKQIFQSVNQCTYSIVPELHWKNKMQSWKLQHVSDGLSLDNFFFLINFYDASYLKYITWQLWFIILYYFSPLTPDNNIHSRISKRLICPCVLLAKYS